MAMTIAKPLAFDMSRVTLVTAIAKYKTIIRFIVGNIRIYICHITIWILPRC
jgi:hypothetical protein